MKKANLTSFSILFLSFVLFVMPLNTLVSASPSTINVPQDYRTIQEAINQANSGDTIFVKNGTYYEHVVVNKTVSLIGEDMDLTIVDGRAAGSVIFINASKVHVRGFTIRNSGYDQNDNGITIDRSSGNDIRGNKIKSNNNGGIGLSFSSNNVISSNFIYSDINNGIGLSFSSNNIISGNAIYSNILNGINVYSSSNNVISDNAIYSNNYYGIYLSLSINNTIYHNNFNNIRQASSSYLNNVWDYEGEGNYWSNYNGTDLFQGPSQNEIGSDGIGDTPYIIDANNKDNYPLMGRFSNFNVTLKRETYYVTVTSNSTISDFRFEVGVETGNKIIRFNATGKESTVGFSRVTIPTTLMNSPFIVLVGEEEIILTVHNVSRGMYAYLYFTYVHSSDTITIISSKTLLLYNELLDKHIKLQTDLNNLNATYQALLNNNSALLGNYSQLQNSYRELNNSYQAHLQDESENVRNIRNLTYIIAATTAIFIVTTVYLSKSTRPLFNRLTTSSIDRIRRTTLLDFHKCLE